ncbi:1818_t:CDS:1 [Ambispora leptoticha]|uniref:1818_t:CDS:1 n=1 Tax=Ambispora leptoticha TaxID=144679 RepID=A0A9N8VSN9_9GLOM|nr:1818_t:CDS:1 [Ambispora leptoticha]
MESLPIEIRQDIYKKCDIASLSNFLRVNRQFCHEIVPILWADPLTVGKRSLSPQTRQTESATLAFPDNTAKIIDVYVADFSKDTWNNLRSYGIQPPLDLQAPTFKYVSFLRHYEPRAVDFAAGAWLKKNQRIDQKKRRIFVESLCHLLLNNAKRIQSCYYDVENDVDFWGSIPRERSKYLIFENLRELRIKGIHETTNLRDFFENFAEYCHSLYGIKLDCYKDSDITEEINDTYIGLRNVIVAQKDFQWLELTHSSAFAIKFVSSSFDALSNALRALRFYRIDFGAFKTESIFLGLKFCNNLVALDFFECMKLEQETWINTAKYFKKLEFLAIEIRSADSMPLEFINKIIRTSDQNLQHLLVSQNARLSVFEKNYITQTLIPLILKHSRNLRTVNFPDFRMENAITLLENCSKLEHVDVYSSDLDQAFRTMAEKLPNTCVSIGFHDLSFLLENLEEYEDVIIEFLEATHHHLAYCSIYPYNLNDFTLDEKIFKYGVSLEKKPVYESKIFTF